MIRTGSWAIFLLVWSSSLLAGGPAHAVDSPHPGSCSACHGSHGASYPALAHTLCEGCHFDGGPATAVDTHSSRTTDNGYGNWDLDCWACHDPHTQQQDRAYGTSYGKYIRKVLQAQIKEIDPADPGPYYEPLSILRTVNSSSIRYTATDEAVDGDGSTDDDICQVCHVSTTYYNTGGAANLHADYGGDSQPGGNCTTCHPHDTGFSASGGCTGCHTMGGAHDVHTSVYSYQCSTCHFGHGSGTPTHDDGNNDVAFDPNGLATRNGLDANAPLWSSTGKTCNDVYCHSNGVTADRGSDGTYTWGGLPFGTVSYAVTPAWDTGSIAACSACHSGQGNMSSPYYITRRGPLTGTSDFPDTGSHQRGAHVSNSQDFDDLPDATSDWLYVQCFWCHNANGADPINGNNTQGTYGTSYHVDGQTYFSPKQFQNGGTMANGISYAADGSAAHCGNGKGCW